ncbi:MAG: protein kinase [Planctomycetaceae bacterium]|nr:protein kinase [Planctomycetaceae bacterium]
MERPATSSTRAERLESVVEAFERAWTTSVDAPDLTDFIPRNGDGSVEILIELIRVDIDLRTERGCRKALSQYLVDFPEAFQQAAMVSQVAFEDYRARLLIGENVSPTEYASQFGISVVSWPLVESTSGSIAGSRSLWNSTTRDASDRSADFPEVPSEYCGFTLLTELGRGSFSRVYLARQSDLASRFVVLKVSRSRFSDADQLAQLQHGHIVPVYSTHQSGKMTVVCMPYFGAATFADLWKSLHGMKTCPTSGQIIVDTLSVACLRTLRFTSSGKPSTVTEAVGVEILTEPDSHAASSTDSGISPDQPMAVSTFLKRLSATPFVSAVLQMTAELADALHHAHERGLLHRDLKPANILLADDGRPMLLDFNLAVSNQGGNAEGTAGGTLPYMSPEQLQTVLGEATKVDERSDIYALGLILFELLTGQHPFPMYRGTVEEIARRMLSDRRTNRPPMRQRNAMITPAVEAIVRKCIEPDPDLRYRSADQLKEDLERHLADLPLRFAAEPSLQERAHKWLRRHTRFTAVTTVGLLAGGFFLGASAYRENKRLTSLEQQVEEAMASGQAALEADDPELAQGRFLRAWMLVQLEPSFAEHRSSVAGWLDHARRATLERQMKWHVAPRTFELRRDEAFLLGMQLPDLAQPQLTYAEDAVRDSLTYTVANDPGWTEERRRLVLLAAELAAADDTSATTSNSDLTTLLEDQDLAGTREWHQTRAARMKRAGLSEEAARETTLADQSPPNEKTSALLEIVRHSQQRDYQQALQAADRLTQQNPQLFLGRFLKAVCLWKLERKGEAQVCLESCLAQRPDFLWTEYFLARIHFENGKADQALRSFRKLEEYKPSPALLESLNNALEHWDFGPQASVENAHP